MKPARLLPFKRRSHAREQRIQKVKNHQKIEKVRSNAAEGISLGDAIHKAADDCIREHILEDFLRENRNEVEKSMAIDMTWEVREGLIRKEEREEGRMEGKLDAIKRMIQKGFLKESILELDYSEEEYETAQKTL